VRPQLSQVPVTAATLPSGHVTWRWCVLVGSLVLAGACTGSDDAGETAEGAASTVTSPAASGVVPSGFGTISVTVTLPDGSQRELCLHLADTPELRSRGLMEVTDLDGLAGMLFRYDEPHDGRFWMRNTLLPLSIAFYGPDGQFVSATDMEPCPPDADCPRYSAEDVFTAAVEVPQGDLAELGLVAGSTLQLGASPCR
jgi:uncharacterized membrane protein (UPF0127 family)